MKILIIVNDFNTIYNFRMELIEKLIEKKYKVFLASPNHDLMPKITMLGVNHINTVIDRRSKNPLKDLFLYRQYKKILNQIKPKLVLTYTIKPNIYGNLACKREKIPVISNVTGLGTAITKKGILSKILQKMYKRAFKNTRHVFFQNKSNQNFFVEKKLIGNNYSLIPGSGVNINKFKSLEYPKNKILNITFIGRIMKDKGIDELLTSIIILNYKNLKFNIIGSYENSEYKKTIDDFVKNGRINYYDHVDDVIPFIKKSDAIINPSHHEGMSNVLLEAAASARPILASNISGCKETFDDGVSGISFESKNVDSLVDAINKFASLSYDERKLMGLKGREKVKKEFDRNIVIQKYIEKIEKILKENI